MKLCPKCQKQFSDDANFCPVDAARLAPLEAAGAPGAGPGPDALSARFDLGPKLGGGQTGEVFRAVDKQTGAPCAVKIVSKAVVALPGVAQRLERELKQLERVQSPGVAKVLASGKRGDDTWVAMELLEGAQTLAAAIATRGAIPPDQAAQLVEVIGEALIEAAQVGVVHRDLAPKNVLFAGQDVKLVNFSLPLPINDKTPGVPDYIAPEQHEGKPVDQRSNLYSLGALYYFVVTGQPPGTMPRPPSVAAPGANVPANVEAVIMRALDRSPTKRYLTVRQFVDEVGKLGEVIELKATAPLGKAGGRPKGELVQTLMGMQKGGGLPISQAPTAAGGVAAVSPPPSMVAPAAPVVAAPAAMGSNVAKPMAQTVMGVPSGQAPGQMPVPAGPVGMKPLTPPAGVPMQAPPQATPQSPWAPPPQVAAQAAPAMPPPVVAQPVVAAPVLAAPVVAAPQVAQQPAGKKRPGEEGKGKFRETMWFKKGDLDAQAAQAAADERARTGKEVATDKADSLPIDERYKDDGSISRTDKEKYSLRTGATMMMQKMPDMSPDDPGASRKVSEDKLVAEMKGGRTWIILLILVGIGAIGAIIAMIAK